MAVDALATQVLLLSLRLAATFGFTPIFASVPPLVRVALVIGLSTTLVIALPHEQAFAGGPAALFSDAALLAACVREVALGITLALGIQLAFAASAMAGQILSLQMGFGLAQAIDPVSNRQAPIITSILNQLAIVALFVGNGHHALLRGIAYSIIRVPLGTPWPLEGAAQPTLSLLLATFGLGFTLVAPVVFTLLMLELALGVLARNLPQINMLTFGAPIKIVVGLVAVAAWVGGLNATFDRLYDALFREWDAILSATDAYRSSASRGLVAQLPFQMGAFWGCRNG